LGAEESFLVAQEITIDGEEGGGGVGVLQARFQEADGARAFAEEAGELVLRFHGKSSKDGFFSNGGIVYIGCRESGGFWFLLSPERGRTWGVDLAEMRS
jgi:hypothetical protein